MNTGQYLVAKHMHKLELMGYDYDGTLDEERRIYDILWYMETDPDESEKLRKKIAEIAKQLGLSHPQTHSILSRNMYL